jgi:hypothetical protein
MVKRKLTFIAKINFYSIIKNTKRKKDNQRKMLFSKKIYEEELQ